MLGMYLAVLDTEEEKIQFEDLYIKYRQMMYAVAYRILNNSEDAEDAVHQSFLAIANHFKKIQQIPSQELKAYLVIVSKNKAINIYNKNKERAKKSTVMDEAHSVAVDINYLGSFEKEELVRAIKKLPQIYKDIVYLYYLEEFSAKEIAQILDITPETVWKRAERVKGMLKENLLKESGEVYE